jgi:hypothetical protein
MILIDIMLIWERYLADINPRKTQPLDLGLRFSGIYIGRISVPYHGDIAEGIFGKKYNRRVDIVVISA